MAMARRVECAFYEIDPRTGVTIKISCADHALLGFGGRAAGWYWRYRQTDCPPDIPNDLFLFCLDAYRDALRLLTPET